MDDFGVDCGDALDEPIRGGAANPVCAAMTQLRIVRIVKMVELLVRLHDQVTRILVDDEER